MLKRFWLVLVLSAAPTLAAAETWLQAQTENMHRLQGRFVQLDYGFSVAAPPGALAYVTDGGDANHGVLMILGNHRKITVDPEYIGPDLMDPEPKPCNPSQLPFKATELMDIKSIKLGGLPACRVMGAAGGIVWNVVQATKTDRGTDIMYTLELQTNARALKRDRLVFDEVVQNFRLERILP